MASENDAAAGRGAYGAASPIAITAVTWVDRALAAAVVLLLLATLVAVARGRDEWQLVPVMVWLHLATIIMAMALSPVMLLRRRGDRLHRVLGMMWLAAMAVSALISFDLRLIRDGQFSPIHILSFATLVLLPRLWWTAHHHNIAEHRRGVRLIIGGALLIAGFFTFGFNRILAQWLFGGPGI